MRIGNATCTCSSTCNFVIERVLLKMISALVLIDTAGDIILLKQYRKDFSMSALENYRISLISTNEIANSPPINFIDGTSFLHTLSNDIYYVACVKENADTARVFELLLKIPNILMRTLSLSTLNDRTVRDYIPDIIEIFEEMLDFGYPQQTEPDALAVLTFHTRPETFQTLAAVSLSTSTVPWRPLNIQHKEQNVYVDVVEKVSLLKTADGSVLNKCINGTTTMNASLNDMPECTIIFNTKAVVADKLTEHSTKQSDSIVFDNITFHQCVRLTKFASNKEISFIPPDGPFELMRYSKSEFVQAPFDVKPSVKELGSNMLKITIHVYATYDKSLKATNFRLVIPLPQNTASVQCQPAEKSEARYDELQNAVIWNVFEFGGDTNSNITITTQYLSATYKTSAATKLNQPIHAEFQIPRLSASGFSLNIFRINPDTKHNLYIRYATEAGRFQIMMPSPAEI